MRDARAVVSRKEHTCAIVAPSPQKLLARRLGATNTHGVQKVAQAPMTIVDQIHASATPRACRRPRPCSYRWFGWQQRAAHTRDSGGVHRGYHSIARRSDHAKAVQKCSAWVLHTVDAVALKSNTKPNCPRSCRGCVQTTAIDECDCARCVQYTRNDIMVERVQRATERHRGSTVTSPSSVCPPRSVSCVGDHIGPGVPYTGVVTVSLRGARRKQQHRGSDARARERWREMER
jgi:hypothetical protein